MRPIRYRAKDRHPRSAGIAVAVSLAVSSLTSAEPTPLSERNYQAQRSMQGIVMLQVNWGRKWKCGAFENAQLESLTFAGPYKWEFVTPSRLDVSDTFRPYAFLLTPGKYVLTGYDVKVARSVSEVSHLRGDETALIHNGEPIGGVFSVEAGEIVYIGHIGLDCAGEPIPWRYYIESRAEFDRYVDGFKRRFPFLVSTPVTYRLMTTKLFGQDHSLDDVPEPAR